MLDQTPSVVSGYEQVRIAELNKGDPCKRGIAGERLVLSVMQVKEWSKFRFRGVVWWIVFPRFTKMVYPLHMC